MSKNTRNRILLTAIAALLLVAVTVGGTMAWLQDDTEPVVNEFTGSKVEVEIKETAGTDTDSDGKREFQIIPGGTTAKDPKAWIVDGSEAAWLFVEIVETNNSFLIDDGTVQTPGGKVVLFEIADGWTVVSGPATNGNVTTTVIGRAVAEGDNAEYSILKGDTITFNQNLGNVNLNGEHKVEPELSFTAYAIQSENLTKADGTTKVTTAAEAWAVLNP